MSPTLAIGGWRCTGIVFTIKWKNIKMLACLQWGDRWEQLEGRQCLLFKPPIGRQDFRYVNTTLKHRKYILFKFQLIIGSAILPLFMHYFSLLLYLTSNSISFPSSIRFYNLDIDQFNHL